MTDTTETPPPPPEESKMDIHKPKPIRNWRELLTKIGFIVPPFSFGSASRRR